MRRIVSCIAAIALLAATMLPVSAQPAPTQSTCPYIAPGVVLTAAQWNYCFAIKNDTLGYTPLNLAGGTMTGPLITAPSVVGASGFNIPNGTAPTSPNAGDIWGVGPVLFAAPTAANPGQIVNQHFRSSIGSYTLTDTNAVQTVFNRVSGVSAITLPGSTGYFFELVYLLTNTGTTSHTWAVLFGGTATLTSGSMACWAVSSSSNAVSTPGMGYTATLASAYVVTAPQTSATENVTIKCNGRVNINAGGTFIPQIQASATPGGTETMLSGSFFSMWAIGTNAATSVGDWN